MIAELSTRVNEHLDDLVAELANKTHAPRGAELPVTGEEIAVRQRQIRDRIDHLRRVVAGLELVHPATLAPGQIGFGSRVEVEDLRSGERMAYTLMSGDVLDLDAGEISLASPVGQALLGRRSGDEVEVETPQRRRRLRIVGTSTLVDQLEAAGQRATERPQ